MDQQNSSQDNKTYQCLNLVHAEEGILNKCRKAGLFDKWKK